MTRSISAEIDKKWKSVSFYYIGHVIKSWGVINMSSCHIYIGSRTFFFQSCGPFLFLSNKINEIRELKGDWRDDTEFNMIINTGYKSSYSCSS